MGLGPFKRLSTRDGCTYVSRRYTGDVLDPGTQPARFARATTIVPGNRAGRWQITLDDDWSAPFLPQGGFVSALAVHDSLTFNELKALLETSDGNVSVHARKLEDAGYISCKKGFDGRVPRTEYKLTAAGRKALEQYLAHMEALIKRVGGA